MEVPLEPFDVAELVANRKSEREETSFEFDAICLPVHRAEELVGRAFQFPANPAPGCVDGSIYFESAHNPVDLFAMSFGRIANGEIDATLSITIRFEFEMSGFQDREAILSTSIRLPRELWRGGKDAVRGSP